MESKWFFAGVIIVGLILIFDKPLAAQVSTAIQNIAPVPTPAPAPQKILAANSSAAVNGCQPCSGAIGAVIAPSTPSTVVIGPSHSLPSIVRRYSPGSPAQPFVPVNQNTVLA
jgi:hypothetical protein